MPRAVIIVLALVAITPLCACSVRLGGSKSLDATLAELRTENQRLRAELAQSQGLIKELEAREASTAHGTSSSDTAVFTSEELALAMPSVVTLAFHSGAGFDLRDPANPRLVMDVETRDGRERFVPAVGRLRVMAKQGETVLADITLSPVELRDAYRSGLMGTRYTLEQPVPAEALTTPVRLHASLLLATGQTLEAERTIPAGR